MTTLLLAWALAAPAWAAPPPPPESPDWSDDKARTDAQMDVVAALLESDLPDKALAILADMRANGVKDRRLDVLQARALHATGMTAEAKKMLEAHTKAAPRDAEGWSALGVILADAQDIPGSIRALEKARRITPSDPVVLNNLGYARLAHGDAEQAVALFQASLVQDPSQPRTRNNLGFALARLERDMDALQAFRAAGEESDARYNLGVACVNRGDRANALAQFSAALEASPGHPAASAALERLLQEAP